MEKALLVVGTSSDMGLATIKALENDYDLIIGHYRTMNEHLLAQAKKWVRRYCFYKAIFLGKMS